MPTLTLIILTKVGKNIAYDITPNKKSYGIGNDTFIYSSLVVCLSDTFFISLTCFLILEGIVEVFTVFYCS